MENTAKTGVAPSQSSAQDPQASINIDYRNLLLRILQATNWTQEELARVIGVSFSTINSWTTGKSEPRATARAQIDMVALEVLGRDAIDADVLKQVKSKAVSKKCTVNKIVNNRDLLERLTVSLTYHNNATEGSTMTESDVMAVVYRNQTLRNRTATEQREAVNHQTALYFLLDELKSQGSNFTITPELIKATHLRMMNGIISDAGYYRDHAVRIRGGHVALANYLRIPELINNWCNLANGETTDAIGLLARSHAEFERIHPFSDGNGRTGRLLLFILALSHGLTPPILQKEKHLAYYKYLELAQMREETDPLEYFIATAILDTADIIDKTL